MLNKIGRALNFTFVPQFHAEAKAIGVSLWSTLQAIWSYLRSSHDGLADAYRGSEFARELWIQNVIWRGATAERLASRVRAFQVMALIAAGSAAYSLYVMLDHGVSFVALGCLALAAIYYLQAALSLFQIREQFLCSVYRFLLITLERPSELLPRGLPRGWRLVSLPNFPTVQE